MTEKQLPRVDDDRLTIEDLALKTDEATEVKGGYKSLPPTPPTNPHIAGSAASGLGSALPAAPPPPPSSSSPPGALTGGSQD